MLEVVCRDFESFVSPVLLFRTVSIEDIFANFIGDCIDELVTCSATKKLFA